MQQTVMSLEVWLPWIISLGSCLLLISNVR